MKLTGTTEVEVEVSKYAVVAAATKLLQEAYGLNSVDGLDSEGRMVQSVEYHTSHSWDVREDRGEPGKEQVEALAAIAVLKQALYVGPMRKPK